MLFNSYEFIFIFVPLVLAGFFLLGARSRVWAVRWLISASLLFYAWWRPVNVLIIAPSIVVNFLLARTLQRLAPQDRPATARTVLLAGIGFNILFLGYFKYANFTAGVLHDVLGTNLVLERIILPLGISFITFQKIAFLVDVHARRVEAFSLRDYALFVLFFPQLIAGPIVHYREMMSQFHRAACRFEHENVSVGLTLFLMGLCKKVFLADGIAPMVAPIYTHAAAGGSVSLLPAWMAALGFTLQIYFDFSGYSDMALGLGRAVGVHFPANFYSPLKASSIIDFWQRWHMTLTRFLTAYVYNPLALRLTRRRLARGLRPFVGANRTVGAFLQLVMLPTMLTMFVSGLWHGAGYTFILWGLLHGLYLTINHAWRLVGPRLFPDKEQYARLMTPIGFAITFIGVAAGMVLFRATTPHSAGILLQGMVGANGVALPTAILDRLGALGETLRHAGIASGMGPETDFVKTGVWILGLGIVALGLPNTLQILAQYQPALGPLPEGGAVGPRFRWEPSPVWALVVAVIGAIGMLHLGGQSEFLYWQF